MAGMPHPVISRDTTLYPDVSPHGEMIEKLYSVDTNCFDGNLKSVSEKHQVVFVCFSNRSGSNLLLDTIGRLGFCADAGDEFFNADVVLGYNRKMGFQSFEKYLQYIFELRGLAGKPIFLKVGPHQLFWLANRGYISKYFLDAKYVLIEREDKIAQAVSYFIADQTGEFLVKQSSKSKAKSSVQYSKVEIWRRLQYIVETTILFQYYFTLHTIRAPIITYEQLDCDAASSVERVMTQLELEQHLPENWKIAAKRLAPNIVRQASLTNQAFADRFRSEMQLSLYEQPIDENQKGAV